MIPAKDLAAMANANGGNRRVWQTFITWDRTTASRSCQGRISSLHYSIGGEGEAVPSQPISLNRSE